MAVAAVVLLTVCCVLMAVGRLLDALGDVIGARVLNYTALLCGVLLLVDLILLVLVQALAMTDDKDDEAEK